MLTNRSLIADTLVDNCERLPIQPMLDNQDIAVLTRVNDLAQRHGLMPYHFVATFGSVDDDGGGYVLNFEIPASGNALREERFERMLRDIGIVLGNEAALRGDVATIIDALDMAIQAAPRPRLGL